MRFIALDEIIDLYINWRTDERNKAVERFIVYAEITGKEYTEKTDATT